MIQTAIEVTKYQQEQDCMTDRVFCMLRNTKCEVRLSKMPLFPPAEDAALHSYRIPCRNTGWGRRRRHSDDHLAPTPHQAELTYIRDANADFCKTAD